jgi:hypothetical protein
MIHDTAHPLACCERCKRAEILRRAKRRPQIRYSQTASSGRVEIHAAGREIALLRRDSFSRSDPWWDVVRVAEDLPAALRVELLAISGIERKVAVDLVAALYTNAWKSGEIE